MLAIKGKVDNLIGLKENVIIGKLIPAGTGCEGDRPQNAIVMAKAKELRDKRIARMHEVQDEEFDNIVNENLTEELPKMDEEPSLDQDGIINDSDVLDNQSIEINE